MARGRSTPETLPARCARQPPARSMPSSPLFAGDPGRATRSNGSRNRARGRAPLTAPQLALVRGGRRNAPLARLGTTWASPSSGGGDAAWRRCGNHLPGKRFDGLDETPARSIRRTGWTACCLARVRRSTKRLAAAASAPVAYPSSCQDRTPSRSATTAESPTMQSVSRLAMRCGNRASR